MSKDYDQFLSENFCPWCDEAYSEVNHTAGCLNPKDPPSKRGKELMEFLKIFYSELTDDGYLE